MLLIFLSTTENSKLGQPIAINVLVSGESPNPNGTKGF